MRNRYYSPILGRWLTRDPIGYQGGINLYGYVGNDPAGGADVQGKRPSAPVPGNFIPGMVTFTLSVAGEPLRGHKRGAGGKFVNADASVRIFVRPTARLLSSHCCDEIRFVQFASERGYLKRDRWLYGPVETGRWHLDDAGNASNFYHRTAPYFLQQIPWTPGALQGSTHDWPGPTQGQLAQDFEVDERFKTYAVCTKGKLAGHSFGYIRFAVEFFLRNRHASAAGYAILKDHGTAARRILSGNRHGFTRGDLAIWNNVAPLAGGVNIPLWSIEG